MGREPGSQGQQALGNDKFARSITQSELGAMKSDRRIRVLIVDDYAVVREGLRAIIDA